MSDMCPECGEYALTYDDMPGGDQVCPGCNHRILSDPGDRLDQLVQQASVPNLASLFQKGKDRGLITPQADYGHTASV